MAAARRHGFDKILVGECSTRLSVRILTDMAEGRGSQVASDTVSIYTYITARSAVGGVLSLFGTIINVYIHI